MDNTQEEQDARSALEARYKDVMTTSEMTKKFEVLSFCAGVVVVRDRETGMGGTLEFTHMPRFYFGWIADSTL